MRKPGCFDELRARHIRRGQRDARIGRPQGYRTAPGLPHGIPAARAFTSNFKGACPAPIEEDWPNGVC
jgi:hypothetical protein